MKLVIDALVTGIAGTSGKPVVGRVINVARSGMATIIDTATGRQAQIYEPEVVDHPRPQAARTDIPARFR